MFDAFERLVAMRYLRSRRQEGFISVIAGFSLLGIGLGVATLIVVMSVMNGFREELLSRILGLNGHITVVSPTGSIVDFDPIAERLKALDGVVSVTPNIEGQVLANGPNGATGALVRGMRAEDLRSRPLLAEGINMGRLDLFEGTDRVVIGDRLAQRLGVTVGDQVTLVSPQGTTTVVGTVPRMKAYTVVATFNVGMFEYDSTYVYMPLEAAQLFFRLPDAVSGIEMFTSRPDRVRDVWNEVYQVVGPELRVVDWQQSNRSFFDALKVERNVMFLILTLIIIVAAFNIISGQIMLVKDKGRDIAILRTMGATRGRIMRIFFMSGASIGVVGTLAGLALGVAFADNIELLRQWLEGLTGMGLFPGEIYFLSNLPSKILPGDVIAVTGMSLGLSFLATVYPAWRAARLDPVEALRYE